MSATYLSIQESHYDCDYMTQPKLRDFIPRIYQESIFDTASRENTLVVLPTGLGKTAIAMMLSLHRLETHKNSKIIFLAPTKPLAQQHIQTFTNHLPPDIKMDLFTGEVSPKKREELWENTQIIFSTPQSIENDVISNRLDLKKVSLMIFDEAHRATGEYSYNFIAKRYEEKADYPRILALTASPGSDFEKITEVCGNLFIENIEVRTDNDPDVRPYVQETKTTWVEIDLPEEILNLKKKLDECLKSKLQFIKSFFPKVEINSISKSELLGLQARLRSDLLEAKDFEAMKAISVLAEIMKIEHALELLESQSISALSAYFDSLWNESLRSKTKALQNLVRDELFKQAYIMCRALNEKKIENPKIEKLKEIVESEIKVEKVDRIMIFNHFRDTASVILEELNKIEGVKAELFVGQAKRKDTGMTHKKQKEIIENFRNGNFNVLISTSIGEEGLDIPKVDDVIFYEPIPSAIRHIQRRGRTGRSEKGKIIVLVARDTRDVGYRWSAFYKEKRMYRLLDELKMKRASILKKRSVENKQKSQTVQASFEKSQQTLQSYEVCSVNKESDDEEIKNRSKISSSLPLLKTEVKNDPDQKIKIYVDAREKNSAVLKRLEEMGIQMSIQRLDVSDYLLSERVGIEYKKSKDFVDSIIDGRLLSQVKSLKENLERPVILVEGNVYNERSVHPNAIRGMIAAIVTGYGVPVLFSENYEESAYYIYTIAKRESNTKEYGSPSLKPISTKELQEFIISSLPGIGIGLAKPLLRHFKSIKKLVNASTQELMMVEGIGHKKAQEIRKILEEEYHG